jgi:hypothetical protein
MLDRRLRVLIAVSIVGNVYAIGDQYVSFDDDRLRCNDVTVIADIDT